ncbi:MAG: hypothetical protein AAF571_01765 [Verrucomicrobiota bacterium]
MNEFPDWLSPVLVKELRQGLRTKGFVVTFLLLQCFFVVLMLFSVLQYSAGVSGNFNVSTVSGFFWTLVAIYLLAITPGRAMGVIHSEVESGTLELLTLTRLTSWKIAEGKWISLVFQNVLVIISILPYGVLRYFFGGVNLMQDFAMLAMLIVASFVITAVAIGISGFAKWLRITLIIAYSIGGLIFFVGYLSSTMMGAGSAWPSLIHWVASIWDAAFLVVFGLSLAAGAIAAPVENYALTRRLICIAFLIPALALPFLLMDLEEAVIYWMIAALIWGIVLIQGLCSGVNDFYIQRHAFRPGGKFRSFGPWLGSFFYPTWPSGVRFSVVSVFLWSILLLCVILYEGEPSYDELMLYASMSFLAISFLLTPLSLILLVGWPKNEGRWIAYLTLHVLFWLLAIFAYLIENIIEVEAIYAVLLIIPPSYFWTVIMQYHDNFWLVWISAIIGLLINMAVIYLKSRPYWTRVRTEFRLAETPEPPPINPIEHE